MDLLRQLPGWSLHLLCGAGGALFEGSLVWLSMLMLWLSLSLCTPLTKCKPLDLPHTPQLEHQAWVGQQWAERGSEVPEVPEVGPMIGEPPSRPP